MSEYAHNHPPRCCCAFARDVDAYEPTTPCALCPEHGELAQLGDIESPPITAVTEYPCCHQLVGRPHTDYCRAGFAGQVHATVLEMHHRLGNPLGMTRQPHTHHHGADVHPTHQCHPDRCGMWA